MTNRNVTKKSFTDARRFLNINEQFLPDVKKQKGGEISESGTPTTALPPSTDATRQLDADVAASANKPGIPAPVGATPSQNNGEYSQGGLDVNGEDEPAHGLHGDSKTNSLGYAIGNAPGTDTTKNDANSDASRQIQSDVAKAMNKSGTGLRISEASNEDIVNALIEALGGTDELMFRLMAEGTDEKLAEAIVEGTIDLDEIREGLVAFATSILGDGEPIDENAIDLDEALADLSDAEAVEVLRSLVAEGFGDSVKKGIASVFKSRKTSPSPGYLATKAKHMERKAGDNRVISTERRSFGVGNEGDKPFRSFRKA